MQDDEPPLDRDLPTYSPGPKLPDIPDHPREALRFNINAQDLGDATVRDLNGNERHAEMGSDLFRLRVLNFGDPNVPFSSDADVHILQFVHTYAYGEFQAGQGTRWEKFDDAKQNIWFAGLHMGMRRVDNGVNARGGSPYYDTNTNDTVRKDHGLEMFDMPFVGLYGPTGDPAMEQLRKGISDAKHVWTRAVLAVQDLDTFVVYVPSWIDDGPVQILAEYRWHMRRRATWQPGGKEDAELRYIGANELYAGLYDPNDSNQKALTNWTTLTPVTAPSLSQWEKDALVGYEDAWRLCHSAGANSPPPALESSRMTLEQAERARAFLRSHPGGAVDETGEPTL